MATPALITRMMSSSKRVKLASDEVIDQFLANVDVWKTIFEMLSVKDRIRLEMTNKRLHMLMFEYWKRVTSFDTDCLTAMSDYLWISEKRWAALVSMCVNRIGDGLRSLTIRDRSAYPVRHWSAHFRSIGEECPNVETINFVLENSVQTLDIRFDSFSSLKTLTVGTAGGYYTHASASVFLSIPTSIEVIRGLTVKWEERFENAAQIEGFFAHRSSLREVDLYCLHTRDKSKANIFRVIAQRCPHLKSIKLSRSYNNNCIEYSGVVALESMKELRLAHVRFDEMGIVRTCERSPLVEALELQFPSNLHLQSAALSALGGLTKLRELDLSFDRRHKYVVAHSLVTEFVRELAQNSGASLRRLALNYGMPLSTAAMEALANGCAKLRHVKLWVRVGEATAASIRFLIDCIVADPSWIPQTDPPTLVIYIYVLHDGGYAGHAAFKALAAPAANLPSGVELNIR